MKDNLEKSQDPKCPPEVKKPANQPKPPTYKECDPLVPPAQPPNPKAYECPKPKCPCDCPSTPGDSTPECLEKLVAAQPGDFGAADKAKLKAELSKIVEAAKKARQEYKQDTYADFKQRWIEADKDIAKMLRQLECVVDCWKCVIECQACSLLNKLHVAEKRLYGDEKRYTDVGDLYDKQYWLVRERGARERKVNRIKDVISAWESPATSIDKALKDNETLYKKVNPQPARAIYDIFFKLIPLHLAIAPPADVAKTLIDIRYTEFCTCGEWKADDCCGPDVSMRSFRERLTPPQAYIINPDDYFKVMCCLIDKKYKPAAEDLIDADVHLALLNNEIESLKNEIGKGWQAEFEKNARAAIPSEIDCSKYPLKETPPTTDDAAQADDVQDGGYGDQDKD